MFAWTYFPRKYYTRSYFPPRVIHQASASFWTEVRVFFIRVADILPSVEEVLKVRVGEPILINSQGGVSKRVILTPGIALRVKIGN